MIYIYDLTCLSFPKSTSAFNFACSIKYSMINVYSFLFVDFFEVTLLQYRESCFS